jgi:hypothetical protein
MDGYDHNTRWRTFKTMILAEKSSGDYTRKRLFVER